MVVFFPAFDVDGVSQEIAIWIPGNLEDRICWKDSDEANLWS